MDAVFLELMNMSITASFLIVVVMVLRLIFKDMPKWIRCLMWGMVGIRLAIPFSIESMFSIIPNAQKYDSTSVSSTSYVATNVSAYSQGVTNEAVNSSINLLSVIHILWVAGVIIMLGYMLVSYIKLRINVRESVKVKENIWMCDRIGSPFVLGIIKPKIYILSEMNKKEIDYVVAHEKAHLKRHDNIWKPLGFVLLCVYWFNPLCWLAYHLFNKDIELACDEKVIRELGKKGKKAYSNALLSCSAESKLISACPLAFGENNVKQRIKNVLSYKNPKIYVVVGALAVCAVVGVMFMTNPLSASAKNDTAKNPNSSVSDILPDDKTDIENPSVAAVVETQPSEEPTTVAETTVEVTEPVTTEPETVAEEVVEETVSEEYYEESYSDDYYEDSYYDDSYYSEDTYSDDSSGSYNGGLVEITPYDYYESEEFKNIQDRYHESYGGDGLLSSSSNSEKQEDSRFNPVEKIDEDAIKWDPLPR